MKSLLYFLSFNSYYFTYYVTGVFIDPGYTVVIEHTKKIPCPNGNDILP